jgi:hypothetical protein
LVGRAEDEAQLVCGHAYSLQHRRDDEAVILGALLDDFDWGLEVVEKGVDVGEEDGHFAAGGEVLRDLDGGDKVATVRATGRCGT